MNFDIRDSNLAIKSFASQRERHQAGIPIQVILPKIAFRIGVHLGLPLSQRASGGQEPFVRSLGTFPFGRRSKFGARTRL